jgi:hypothetical protein
MFSLKTDVTIGSLGVTTTDHKGHSVDEIAEMAVNKIVSISNNADPMIKAQAHAFKDRTKMVVAYYIQEGVKNHICTVCNELEKQGHKDLANIIRRI